MPQSQAIKYDPMGCPIREVIPTKADDRYMVNLQLKVDKDTCSSIPDESDVIDLVDLIQTYKDQCGMELAQRLLKQGVDPAMFADDGKHSGDATNPTFADAQAVANAAVKANQEVAQIKELFGLPAEGDLSGASLEAIIGKYIESHMDQFVAKPAASVPSEGGNE